MYEESSMNIPAHMNEIITIYYRYTIKHMNKLFHHRKLTQYRRNISL